MVVPVQLPGGHTSSSSIVVCPLPTVGSTALGWLGHRTGIRVDKMNTQLLHLLWPPSSMEPKGTTKVVEPLIQEEELQTL